MAIQKKKSLKSIPHQPLTLPSFTFRQLQIQLRQLVSNLFRQDGQIHAAVRHDFAEKHGNSLCGKKPGRREKILKNKNKTPPSRHKTSIREGETAHPHGLPFRHNGEGGDHRGDSPTATCRHVTSSCLCCCSSASELGNSTLVQLLPLAAY